MNTSTHVGEQLRMWRQRRRAIELVLAGHEPYPALAVDRHWSMVAANSAIAGILSGVAPRLLEPPVNVLRVALHPEGLAPRVENYTEWRSHLLSRLRHQIDATADPVLVELHAELQSYRTPTQGEAPPETHLDLYGGVLVPFKLRTELGVLSFFGTTTVFGTPLDITLAEIAIESFFPAEPQTAELLAGAGRGKRIK